MGFDMENNQNSNSTGPVPASKTELNLIGQEISGCVILEKISQGGMGTVFKAKHKALNRIVCIKILSPNLAKDKKAVGLFLTEARAVAELDHQNIVQVYNVGKEKGFYFIVMSFVDGEPLSNIVRKRPNLPIGFIVDTFIGVLKGLQAAHQKGIIHRDIKPSNILITKDLQPKIVDFGIAKKVDQEKCFTKTTELAGTAYFLSPEQAAGKEIDIRADLYSLGASMFYVLTGKYPFTGKNSMEIIQKHINTPVPNMNQYRKGISGWIVQAIEKLMAKNPDNRFQSAADALSFFQQGRANEISNPLKNLNIGEAVGVPLGAEDIKESPRNNAKESQERNMVLPSLNDADKDHTPVQPVSEAPKQNAALGIKSLDSVPDVSATQTDFYIHGRKKELKSMASISNTSIDPSGFFSLKKNKFLLKAFFNTIIATIILIAGVFCFLKLGTLCSGSIGKDAGIIDYFTKPWSSSPVSGQIMWAGICCAYIVMLFLITGTELLKKISIYAFVLAIVSYLFGVTGVVTSGASIGSFTTFSYLPVLALMFVFMAIMLDDCDILPLFYRLFTVVLFACSLMALYSFFLPQEFASGEMITAMLYSLIFTLFALAVMPFMRDSFIMRIATMVIFVFAIFAVWLYQGSGNAYAILNKMPSQKLVDYQVNTNGLSNEAVELLEKKQFADWQAVNSYKDLNELEPTERRQVFIERLKKNYSLENKDKIDSLIWNFALTEPFVKFNHYYKTQNLFFFILIMGVMYGIFMFIIQMLIYREDRWNLI